MRHTQKQIKSIAKQAGISLQISMPGDGVSRYEFFTPGPQPHTYGRSLCFCLGTREAWLFLRGWLECQFEEA